MSRIAKHTPSERAALVKQTASLSVEDAATRLGASASSVIRWRKEVNGPAPKSNGNGHPAPNGSRAQPSAAKRKPAKKAAAAKVFQLRGVKAVKPPTSNPFDLFARMLNAKGKRQLAAALQA